MKNVLLAALITAVLFVSGQVPQAINYQAIARDGSGNPLPSRVISIRITIEEGINPGFPVYRESHAAVTNQFGLFTLKIGLGSSIMGSFPAIDWATGNKYIIVEFDANGGNNYTNLGTTQLISVPYALYA